jgi:hypothetical protein
VFHDASDRLTSALSDSHRERRLKLFASGS